MNYTMMQNNEMPPPDLDAYGFEVTDPARLALADELQDQVDWSDGSGPKYLVTDPVQNVGTALAPIVWSGRQWAVTTRGLEARNGMYTIDGADLWGDVMRDMATKVWVDLRDLAEALRIGRRVFGLIEDVAENDSNN